MKKYPKEVICDRRRSRKENIYEERWWFEVDLDRGTLKRKQYTKKMQNEVNLSQVKKKKRVKGEERG